MEIKNLFDLLIIDYVLNDRWMFQANMTYS